MANYENDSGYLGFLAGAGESVSFLEIDAPSRKPV